MSSFGETQRERGEWRQAGHDTAERARETGRQMAQTVREKGRAIKEQTKAQFGRAADKVKERGRETVRQQRDRVAEELGVVGSALHDVASRLHEREGDVLAGLLAQCGDALGGGVERLSRYIREADVKTCVRQASDVARRQPAAFMAGMFIAGFATARFLKASQGHAESEQSEIGGSGGFAEPSEYGSVATEHEQSEIAMGSPGLGIGPDVPPSEAGFDRPEAPFRGPASEPPPASPFSTP